MSEELHDIRSKIPTRTHSLLQAIEQATGQTQSEIVRDVLQQWAEKKLHEATIIARVMRGQGIIGSAGE